jgi:tripartite-type tricarboxylate transporter receptor subunit TctC
LPPGVPQDRILALQAAFVQTMQDPEFLAEAGRAQQDIQPIPGPELKRSISEFLQMPAAVHEKLEKLLEPEP